LSTTRRNGHQTRLGALAEDVEEHRRLVLQAREGDGQRLPLLGDAADLVDELHVPLDDVIAGLLVTASGDH
jgi:hypothetical protein